MNRGHNFTRIDFDLDRPAPRFNDARVVRAAQRVVPLGETETKGRRKGRLVLTGAFAAAMVLGAAVALVAARLERQRFQAVAVEVSKAELTPAPVETPIPQLTPEEEKLETQTTPLDQRSIETSEETSDSETVVAKAPRPTVKQTQTPPVQSQPQNDSLSDESDQVSTTDNQKAQPPIVDEWQERRLRRIETLYRRNRRASEGRDLLRIDEIFEGTRHP
jgi:hypothetical protein